ncbi:MAG: dGTP triphosphohydrolase [Bryobacteraceae bacterium]
MPGLHHLRLSSGGLRGRRYPEQPHPYRSEFQRDRDRIVHARAFRRLEDKTQVFTAGLSDHFRNRLTHTIEVSQIARTVAAALGLEEDFTEALALAHDIGHPPFAHAGEDELDAQMRRFGERFDHNLHALHIVENFEQRYALFPGLNLTFEVREGMAKHSRDFAPGEIPELDEYLPGLRPPLEAQLIDLADEVAYNTADLDDAFSAGFFGIEEIAQAVPQYAAIRDEVESHFPGATPRIHFLESLRRLIDLLVSGLIEGTAEEVARAGVRSVEDVRSHPVRLAALNEPARSTNAALKRFLRSNVYLSEALAQERRHAAAEIAELFQFFLNHPDRLPEPYDAQALVRPVHRVVCDYIAGMTDGFFRRTHRVLSQAGRVRAGR